MSAIAIPDAQWKKVYVFLKAHPRVYTKGEEACRRFVEGVHWIMRTGAQWRELPERYGNWNSVYQRFARWADKDIWQEMHQAFIEEPDMENVIPDTTVVRAHMCAAGGSRKHGGQDQQALGRSRGGFSTKIHILVDALGNPLRFRLTPGQRHDISQAEALIESFQFENLIADRAFDADWFLELVEKKNAQPVIPPRVNRKEQRQYDTHLYKERHLVECFINKIKWYRRIFTRFEKLAQRYLAFLSFVGALIWLR